MSKNKKPYFKNVKKGDSIFGLVFGQGEVSSVWESDSHYTFEVSFENGYTVPYTDEGIPAWNISFDFQTIFYVEDIALSDYNFEPIRGVLEPKEIIRLRLNGELEVRCPSGFWRLSFECPDYIVQEYYENNELHLFRKREQKCRNHL